MSLDIVVIWHSQALRRGQVISRKSLLHNMNMLSKTDVTHNC